MRLLPVGKTDKKTPVTGDGYGRNKYCFLYYYEWRNKEFLGDNFWRIAPQEFKSLKILIIMDNYAIIILNQVTIIAKLKLLLIKHIILILKQYSWVHEFCPARYSAVEKTVEKNPPLASSSL